MWECLDDYYLDLKSNKFEPVKKLKRTKGSSQIHFWTPVNDADHEIDSRYIEDSRSYQVIRYKSKEVFMKTFRKPNRKDWDIQQSVRYQIINLYLLRKLEFVPNLIFFTKNSIGMEYIQGVILKEYLRKRKTAQEIKQLRNDIITKAEIITKILNKNDRLYDLSYNNIIVKNNRAYFVDFDFSDRQQPVDNIIQVIKDVHNKVAVFTKDGYLLYPKSLSSRFKYHIWRLIK